MALCCTSQFLATLVMLDILGHYKIQFTTLYVTCEHQKIGRDTLFAINFLDFNIVEKAVFSSFEATTNLEFLVP